MSKFSVVQYLTDRNVKEQRSYSGTSRSQSPPKHTYLERPAVITYVLCTKKHSLTDNRTTMRVRLSLLELVFFVVILEKKSQISAYKIEEYLIELAVEHLQIIGTCTLFRQPSAACSFLTSS